LIYALKKIFQRQEKHQNTRYYYYI